MSYLMNSSEIIQTIRMIDQQHLDVRTVTMGINLLDCADRDIRRCGERIYDKLCKAAERLVPVCCDIERHSHCQQAHLRYAHFAGCGKLCFSGL